MSLYQDNPELAPHQTWQVPGYGTLNVLAVFPKDAEVVCEQLASGQNIKLERHLFDGPEAYCEVCDGAKIDRKIWDDKGGVEVEAFDLVYLFGDVVIADLLVDDPEVAEVWMNGRWHEVNGHSELQPGVWEVGRFWTWKPATPRQPADDPNFWSDLEVSLMQDFGRTAGIVVEELETGDLYRSIKATLRAARLAGLKPVYAEDEAPCGYGYLTEADAIDGVNNSQSDTLDRILAIVDGRFEDHPGFGQMLDFVQAVLDEHHRQVIAGPDVLKLGDKMKVIGVDMGEPKGDKSVEIHMDEPVKSDAFAGGLGLEHHGYDDLGGALEGAFGALEAERGKEDEIEALPEEVTGWAAANPEDWKFCADGTHAQVRISRFTESGRLHNATIPGQGHLVLAMVGSRVKANGLYWVVDGFTSGPELNTSATPWPVPRLGMEWALLISEEEAKQRCHS